MFRFIYNYHHNEIVGTIFDIGIYWNKSPIKYSKAVNITSDDKQNITSSLVDATGPEMTMQQSCQHLHYKACASSRM